MSANKLILTTPSDREIQITRVFDAPRNLVWDAWTKPELLKRWMLGPPGWTMPVCEIDLRVGGKYRYVWAKEPDIRMGMGGVYREIAQPERLVATEKFDEPWYPGEGVGIVLLKEQNGKTTLIQTIQYESREARDIVLQSPMESGMSAGYDRLEEVLASLQSSQANA